MDFLAEASRASRPRGGCDHLRRGLGGRAIRRPRGCARAVSRTTSLGEEWLRPSRYARARSSRLPCKAKGDAIRRSSSPFLWATSHSLQVDHDCVLWEAPVERYGVAEAGGMGTVTNDVLSAEAQQTAGQGKQFTPDRIAALLDGWRVQVLREMGRRRLWRWPSGCSSSTRTAKTSRRRCPRRTELVSAGYVHARPAVAGGGPRPARCLAGARQRADRRADLHRVRLGTDHGHPRRADRPRSAGRVIAHVEGKVRVGPPCPEPCPQLGKSVPPQRRPTDSNSAQPSRTRPPGANS